MDVGLSLGKAMARARWRSYLGVALLLGLLGGLSLTAIAGARRTQSSVTEFRQSTIPSTVAVTSSGIYDEETDRAIAALPEVVQARTYVSFDLKVLVDGRPDVEQTFESVGTFDGRFFDQDRFTPTQGRLPDRTRADEVAVNEYAAARHGYRVGQRLSLGAYDVDILLEPAFFEDPPPPDLRREVTVVGIGLFPDEVVQDESDREPRLLFTPAFSNAAAPFVTYGFQGVVLADGDADVEPFLDRLDALVPPGSTETRLTSAEQTRALRAMRPLSIALAVFGVSAGLAGLALVSQAMRRVMRADEAARAGFRSFGAGPRALVVASMFGPALAVVAGSALAVLVAIAASPLMPLGPVRDLPRLGGVDVDAAALGFGGLALALGVLGAALLGAWRNAPHRVSRRPVVRRPSRVVSAAGASGLPPAAVSGLRFALGTGDRAASAVATVLPGAVVAVAALVGSVTFGTSLNTLVDDPALFGWTWDVTILAGNGYGNLDGAATADILDRDPLVDAWSGVYFGSDLVDDVSVSLLGIDPGSVVQPPIVAGRTIEGDDEIVLGRATAVRLRRDVGDTVTLSGDGAPHRLRIVGLATFPTVGAIHAERTSLGEGALVAHRLVPGYDRDITGDLTGDLGPHAAFVRFRAGTDLDRGIAHLADITAPLRGFAGLAVITVQRPAEIVNSRSMGTAPTLLAAVLTLGATASLGLAISASVRRRRDDLAVLRALGFSRRQLRATALWHATAIIVVGLVVGVPLGLAVGSALWRRFAGELDVVARTTVPGMAVAAVVVTAIALANLVAILPAWVAGRIDTTRTVRAEGLPGRADLRPR